MSNNKNKMNVIKVGHLNDFKAFKDTTFINFTKRAGGQLFQFYSLLDNYAEYLGAGGDSEFSSSYLETEVIFSREIYKKHVYSSVILPLYTSDSSTNKISLYAKEPNSYVEHSFFKPQLTPSWFDRHNNSIEFIEGIFRNVYVKGSQAPESLANKALSFISGSLVAGEIIGGVFIPPVANYFHREAEGLTNSISVTSGILQKVLLKALIPTESINIKDLVLSTFAKSTVVENDVLELNFLDINYPLESPKAKATNLDKFSTKASLPPEAPYMKVLSKRGGIRLDIDNPSLSISPNYDWSINLDFQPKELRNEAVILDYSPLVLVRLDDRDFSKLVVTIDGKPSFTSIAGKITNNNWYNLSIEKKGTDYLVYLDKILQTTIQGANKTFFDLNTYLVVGNSKTTYDGFIGNFAKFLIVKNTALVTDSTYETIKGIQPIVGSELDFTLGTVLDKNPNVKWEAVNGATYVPESKGLVFSVGQYIYAYETPDVSIYNFNNFKIDTVFTITSVPSLDNPIRTLLHKTGSIAEEGYTADSGYHISVQRVDDNAKLICSIGLVSIISSTILRVGVDYHVELIKYKNQLLLFINNAFDSSLALTNPIKEDTLSKLILGRFQTKPERDFKGVLKSFKLTNFFRDFSTNRLMEYFPENLEYEDILNFEEENISWKTSNPLLATEYITKTSPKFGEGALKLDDTHTSIIRDSTPVYNFKQKDFTIEGWFKPTSFRQESVIISNGVSPTDPNFDLLQSLVVDTTGYVKFSYSKSITGLASDVIIKSTLPLVLNVWTHIIFMRDRGVFKIYLNGKLSGEAVANGIDIDLSINNTYIGNNNSKADKTLTQFIGTMDSIRITKEEALYEGLTIVVPSEAYGDSNASTLAYLSFNNQYSEKTTKELLLEFNPSPSLERLSTVVVNSKTFEDYNSDFIDKIFEYISWDFNNTLASTGTLPSVTLGGGSTSLYQNVDGRLVYNLDTSTKTFIPGSKSSLLDFGKENFTLEFWMYKVRDYYDASSPGSYSPILTSGATDYLGLMSSNYKLLYTSLGSSTATREHTIELLDSNLLPTNTWFNLTLSKQDEMTFVFVDGILLNTVLLPETLKNNFSFSLQGVDTCIGTYQTYANYFPGKIDKLRITKGVALYTKDYDISKVYDQPIRNTPFQLESTTTIDPKKLYGESLIKFNNSGVSSNNSASSLYTPIGIEQDFSLEFYIQFNSSINRHQTIFSNVQTETLLSQFFSIYRYGVEVEPDLTYRLAITTNPNNLDEVLFLSDQKLIDDVWYNLTLVRVKGVLKLFVNGLLDNKAYLPNLTVIFSKVGLRLGNSIIPNTAMTGYLDSFRYTPKLSVYRNSFDPENIYLTEETSETYIKTEDSKMIYDSISKEVVAPIDNSNTEIKNSVLVTKLPENVSRTGITIPKTNSKLITTEDFTIEVRIFLPTDRARRWTQILCNRDSIDTSSTYLEVSNNSEVDGIAYQSSIRFQVRPFNINLDFGRRSFIENEWNTIAITRKGLTLRGYCNGVLKATIDLSAVPTLDLRLNTYTGLNILHGGQTNAGEVDYVYTLKGTSLYNGEAYLPKPQVTRRDYFSERFTLTAVDENNILPNKTFLESLYTKEQDFAKVVTEKALHKSSLEVDGNTYLKLNYMTKIPKDFKISFWIKPEFLSGASTSYYSVLNWLSLDDYEIDYSINSQGKDKLTFRKGTLSIDTGTFNKTGLSLVVGEWNSIIITKFDNSIALYINGYRLVQNTSLIYSEMNSLTSSDIKIGYNPSKPSSSINFLYDEIKFLRYREGDFLGLYYDSLGGLLDSTASKYVRLPLKNSDASKGTEGWLTSPGVESKLITNLGKYYFKQVSATSSYKTLTQTIDVSEYLDISNNKLLLAWTQSYDNLYQSSSNLSSCDLYFYSKEELELGSVVTSKLNPYTDLSVERELERYSLSRIPVGTAFIKIQINLSYYSYITNIKLFLDSPGHRFETSDYQEEYVAPFTREIISHSLLMDVYEPSFTREEGVSLEASIGSIEALDIRPSLDNAITIEALPQLSISPALKDSVKSGPISSTTQFDTMIITIKQD